MFISGKHASGRPIWAPVFLRCTIYCAEIYHRQLLAQRSRRVATSGDLPMRPARSHAGPCGHAALEH